MSVAVKVRRAAPRKKVEKAADPPVLIPNPVGRIVKFLKAVYREGEYASNMIPTGSIHAVTQQDGYYYYLTDRLGSVHYVRHGSQFAEPSAEERQQFLERTSQQTMHRARHCQTGFDPEVFALKADGTVLPAFHFLPAKKEVQGFNAKGSQTDRYGNVLGFNLQMFWDGFQAEFVGEHGHSCHQSAVDAIQQGLEHIYLAARKVEPEATLTHQCVVETPLELLERCFLEHTALACQPSLNAYGPPDHLVGLEPSQLPFRFAGFHIHLGLAHQKYSEEGYAALVRLLDSIVGVTSVSLLRGLEDERRRRYYGLAGEYRLPPHGLEYRVLSSAALAHPLLTMLLLDLTRQVSFYKPWLSCLWQADIEEVQGIINHLDVAGAEAILSRNAQLFDRLVTGLYEGCRDDQIARAKNLLLNGAQDFLPLGDLAANWQLGQKWKMSAAGPNCSVCRITE